MIERVLRPRRGGILLVTLTAGCLTPGSAATTVGTRAALPGSAGAPTVGNGGAVRSGERPPVPPTANVARPSGTVTSPNLRVLPWAGFKAAVTYTFDDTQSSQIEHWPELKATGVPMTFFANPVGSREQPGFDAAWTAVAAAGNEIGNHTFSHCRLDLTGCTPVGTVEDEIDQATTYIISHFGVKTVSSFAAPFGDAGWNATAAPRFLVGRGVMSGLVPVSGTSDWYNLPCFPVAAGQTATAFDAGIDRARSQGRWIIFMFHSILPTTNNSFAGVDIAGITASVAYAKSLPDLWIDTMTNVGAYARAQQMFERLTPSRNASTWIWTWTLPAHFPPGKVLRVTVAGGTLGQGGTSLTWDPHGYTEVALDAGPLTWRP